MAKKILIVEDERPLNQAMSLELKNAGYEVEAAFDGQEALDFIGTKKYDLILLDLLMPKMNGLDVLMEMKKRNITFPVIVSSNLSDESGIQKAKELGVKDYFIKSDVSLSDIVEAVKKAIG